VRKKPKERRPKKVYGIEFSPEADDQLKSLAARDRTMLLDQVCEQLTHQPTLATRNRGPLRPNPVAQFRLRVAGDWRVYYDVQQSPTLLVIIKTVAFKDRDHVYVGGMEIKL
jgi:mRNA-degrading endonuclease RelE of RelBE toxin-antitoxin system